MSTRIRAQASDVLGCLMSCCLFAISGAALADSSPHQVRDINRVRIPESSDPGYLGVLRGRVLFGATGDHAGYELRRCRAW